MSSGLHRAGCAAGTKTDGKKFLLVFDVDHIVLVEEGEEARLFVRDEGGVSGPALAAMLVVRGGWNVVEMGADALRWFGGESC